MRSPTFIRSNGQVTTSLSLRPFAIVMYNCTSSPKCKLAWQDVSSRSLLPGALPALRHQTPRWVPFLMCKNGIHECSSCQRRAGCVPGLPIFQAGLSWSHGPLAAWFRAHVLVHAYLHSPCARARAPTHFGYTSQQTHKTCKVQAYYTTSLLS